MIFSEEVTKYLEKKHKQIKNDYRDIEGKFYEQCGHIALDIAKILLDEGYKPYIMEASEPVEDSSYIKVIPLVPKLYKGKVKWSAHQVCCCNGLAFDPVIGKPIKLESYSKEMFGRDIQMREVISSNQISTFIERFKKG
jgi:hypothetical protein